MSDAKPNGVGAVKIAMAALLALAILAVWWPTTVMNTQASFSAANAAAALNAGDWNGGANGLSNAASLASPAAPLYHVRLSSFLESAARTEPDDTTRADLLIWSHDAAHEALQWNPLDNRALNQAASAARELARVRPELQSEAVHAAQRWVAAMPGFWQPELALATTYLALDQPELAVAALERVGDITDEPNANESAQRLMVAAFEALGRDADAAAAEQLAEHFAALASASR